MPLLARLERRRTGLPRLRPSVLAATPRRPWTSPVRAVVLAFAVLVVVGTGLLMLPGMRAGGGSADLSTALFTSTSAVTVTGLASVDTATYWSTAGQVAILVLVSVGGFGITTLGSLLLFLLTHRLGLGTRLAAQAESSGGNVELGDVRRVMLGVAVVTVVVEAVVAVALTVRLVAGFGLGLRHAAWFGVFHAVTAWNNAGFALRSDSLIGFGRDLGIMLPITVGIVLGSIGFPVIIELVDRLRLVRRSARHATAGPAGSRPSGPRRRPVPLPVRMSLHTRIMLAGTVVLVVAGTVGVLALEWNNPGTLGPMTVGEKLSVGTFTGGITPRSAGFNIIDYGLARPATLLLTDALMFIGAGSASNGGGIKITTAAVLLFAVVSEARGRADVRILDRRVSPGTVRQALAVLLTFGVLAFAGTMALLVLSPAPLDRVLFEATSALSTCGLSVNLTGLLGAPAKLVLVMLMFVGRIGPVTVASALALRESPEPFRFPEGRPMIG